MIGCHRAKNPSIQRRKAAEDLGVSRHTLWRFLERGQLGRAVPSAVLDKVGKNKAAIEAATFELIIDLEDLLEVPGLGDYSATAILSFGYGVRAAVLDVNVERILLRVFSTTLPPRPSWTLLREVAHLLLPKERHREYNYGLLDLGRAICRYAKPKCEECPLASVCDFFVCSGEEGSRQTEEDRGAYLPSNLRAIRRGRGLSLQGLAEAANVSKLTVIRIEAGRTSPKHETLRKLAQALGVLPEELLS